MLEEVQKLAADLLPEAVACRRHLHSNPELSFEEVATSRFIAQKLTEWGIPHSTGWGGGTGIVGKIEGRNPGRRTVALRADFDALPILEESDTDYKSQNPGVMHACGHDAHTASLLTAARILHDLRGKFDGTIRLVFQPGEEKLPGGASIMIKEGVLKSPRPAAMFGQHVHPSLPAGQIGVQEGVFMASADEIYLTIKGRGGHAAMPHDCVDSVAAAAQVVVALQSLVSRMANPAVPSVLSFGKIDSVGGATNVLPGAVKLAGTFRTMDEKWRADAHRRIKNLAEKTAAAHGATCDVDIRVGYPVLFNDPVLTRKLREAAVKFLGKANVHDLPIRMTAEDFAFYSQKVPACFWRLGTGGEAGRCTSPVHTPTFDIDERALATGAGLMAWAAVSA